MPSQIYIQTVFGMKTISSAYFCKSDEGPTLKSWIINIMHANPRNINTSFPKLVLKAMSKIANAKITNMMVVNNELNQKTPVPSMVADSKIKNGFTAFLNLAPIKNNRFPKIAEPK